MAAMGSKLEYEDLVAAHFPAAVLVPWQAVAADRLPGWRAGIRPLLNGSDAPVFALERHGDADCMWPEKTPSFRIEFSGTDQAELLRAAESFDLRAP